jgi:Spy/CpxP family protein refolding chaperone
MKKTIFVGLFVFSLVLNFAVAATLGWHVWREGSFRAEPQMQGVGVTKDDFQQIRKVMSAQNGSTLMETRQQIMQKNAELLDLVARNPGDVAAAEGKIKELTALKEQMERRAIARISTVMASLPEDKRQAFLVLLKSRSCMMPGMGVGRGGRCGPGQGGMGRCPAPVNE